MATITCGSTLVALSDAESVLDGLLRAGLDVPNSCRGGACQSCMMRTTAGAKPPVAAQQGLKDAQKAQGYFLACVCRPSGDMTVSLADDAWTRARVRVRSVERLTAEVARLILSCDEPFEYRPGQFANVVRSDGLARPYSIASLHGHEPHIEMHVRKVAGGRMSSWIYDEVAPGHELELRGPVGECFYTPGKVDQPLALVGTGTGLAPLYAIARDALRQGHAGQIRLYHGALDSSAFYLVEELKAMAAANANFTYTRCVLNAPADHSADVRVGDIEKIVVGDVGSFAGWRVFLCGNPQLVTGLRKKVFLAGASMKEIHSDAFVMRASA